MQNTICKQGIVILVNELELICFPCFRANIGYQVNQDIKF